MGSFYIKIKSNFKMPKGTISVLAALTLPNLAEARISYGACPTVEDMGDIEHERYMGKWYTIKREFYSRYSLFSECGTRNYEIREDGEVDLVYRVWTPWRGYSAGKGTIYDCAIDQCKATMGGP